VELEEEGNWPTTSPHSNVPRKCKP